MDIPHSLKGEIVHFTIEIMTRKFPTNVAASRWNTENIVREEHVLRVTRIDNHPGPDSTAPFKIWGDQIAGDSDLKMNFILKETAIFVKGIVAYEILTIEQLPLFIGYEFTTPLLEQLIKEGD